MSLHSRASQLSGRRGAARRVHRTGKSRVILLVRRTHRRPRRAAVPVIGLVAALVAALGLAAPAAAGTDPLGPAPQTSRVHHFRNRGFQRLHWTAVTGATSYQVFVKSADYDQPLPRDW